MKPKLTESAVPLGFWLFYWLLLSVNAVHDAIPIRTEYEEFGWKIPFMIMGMLLTTVFLTWLALHRDEE